MDKLKFQNKLLFSINIKKHSTILGQVDFHPGELKTMCNSNLKLYNAGVLFSGPDVPGGPG